MLQILSSCFYIAASILLIIFAFNSKSVLLIPAVLCLVLAILLQKMNGQKKRPS